MNSEVVGLEILYTVSSITDLVILSEQCNCMAAGWYSDKLTYK